MMNGRVSNRRNSRVKTGLSPSRAVFVVGVLTPRRKRRGYPQALGLAAFSRIRYVISLMLGWC